MSAYLPSHQPMSRAEYGPHQGKQIDRYRVRYRTSHSPERHLHLSLEAHAWNRTKPVHVIVEVRKPTKTLIPLLLSLVVSACTGTTTDTTSSSEPIPH
jgi:hypothetical protein